MESFFSLRESEHPMRVILSKSRVLADFRERGAAVNESKLGEFATAA
jgi:hypothetical protein